MKLSSEVVFRVQPDVFADFANQELPHFPFVCLQVEAFLLTVVLHFLLFVCGCRETEENKNLQSTVQPPHRHEIRSGSIINAAGPDSASFKSLSSRCVSLVDSLRSP